MTRGSTRVAPKTADGTTEKAPLPFCGGRGVLLCMSRLLVHRSAAQRPDEALSLPVVFRQASEAAVGK
ncbi:hypothetical protein B1A75_07935 [Geobacillus sp. LEMMY01]|nr:hypothetical protein B1A75_07935 [Geobacillus sp. LEMMY01]